MHVISIVPKAHLDLVAGKKMHLMLAQFADDREYTDFYKKEAANGAYVILDNGVAEGECTPIEKLLEIAEYVGAQEIVLPDVFHDSEATLESTWQALEVMKNMGVRDKYKVMAVAQGADMADWVWCAKELAAFDIDVLGIPKNVVSFGGRDGRLDALFELGHLYKGREVHLLGCMTSALEVRLIQRTIQSQADIQPVRSVDSNIAWAFAREGLVIGTSDKPPGKIDLSSVVDSELLEKNIFIWEDTVNTNAGGKITQI